MEKTLIIMDDGYDKELAEVAKWGKELDENIKTSLTKNPISVETGSEQQKKEKLRSKSKHEAC